MAYWRLPSFQPVTVKGTSACITRVALRGAPHDRRPRPVSTHLAQTICSRRRTPVTRVPRRLPRSVSTRCCHAAAALTLRLRGVKRRKKRLSRSPRLLLASGAYAQACVSGDNGQELGGSTLSKERTCTQVCGSIRSSRWIAVHLLASFARRITGCARPRGSARTSRYVCRSSWALLVSK